jgi:protein LTV1
LRRLCRSSLGLYASYKCLALENEVFVDDGLMDEGDGFFDSLVAGGEGEPDVDEWEDEEEVEVGAYELEVERFKPRRRKEASDDEDVDSLDMGSEAGDTIAELRAASARRPPRPPMSAMSGMSASTMNRSVGLQNLDDQFDKVRRPCCSWICCFYRHTDRSRVRRRG